ncbi:putative bifunctional diguanylate cyclase/phosphodiesterase [Roseibium aestuarii]|uniref:Bifunctional diguanylate cyclase/phosphodiesterase n=1 Tax=Roseibium aestuarii TaxID=2600299 RepID=A0ABW4JW13_9HYPH|nr:EAL domain-containing protein [Roseibium aestuarii]
MLDDLPVKLKIYLPIWIVLTFLLGVGIYGVNVLNDTLKQGHLDKVRAQVESAWSIAEVNRMKAEEGSLTLEEAQIRARDAIRSMVFDNGARVFVFTEQGIRVVSSQLFAEGSSAWESAQTKSMIRLALAGGGVTYYKGARELNGVVTRGVPKASWSQHYAPWGWVIGSAVYLDDVEAAYWNSLIKFVFYLTLSGSVVMLVAHAIIQNMTRPLSQLTANMRQLARGNVEFTIQGQTRRDELGRMAQAMQTFQEHERQRHELRAQLSMLAYTDSLTGLANRARFVELLRAAIDRALDDGRQCALLIFDLDRFKTVNDSLGHLAGDMVLMEFARRLESAVGDSHSVGRLSGDEFFVILTDQPGGAETEAFVRACLRNVSTPMTIEGRTFQLLASCGMAYGPGDTESEAALYRFADMALYEAKTSGGGALHVYKPELSERVDNRFAMEAMMKMGLAEGQFHAYFQAKRDLKTGRIAGAEALCRWMHPDKGMISPADFIPVAEETGLILQIGNQMLAQACDMAVRCNGPGRPRFVVAVNVSPKQLLHGGFLCDVRRVLEDSGCRAQWLELEITESLLLADLEETVELLEALAEMGLMITIDDFGTGYSAMSYLSRFPIKCLKIDQSFVRDMAQDPEKQILVRAILAMAQGLGLKTVAEGVEDAAAAALLSELDCDYGQGYLWHRPVPAHNFYQLLAASRVA